MKPFNLISAFVSMMVVFSTAAFGQSGQMPPGTLWGNPNASQGLGKASLPLPVLDQGGATGTSGHKIPYLDGNNVFSGSMTVPFGTIVANSPLPNGGRLFLQKDSTSTLPGNVAIDVVGQTYRVFENGGSFRGAYIDLTQAAAGPGTDLLNPSYTAPFTGAQLQTVDTKLAQIVNVQDFMPNGANLCDGSTDVTAYYQAALDAGAGKTVMAPNSGVCRVTNHLTMPNHGTTLRGTYPDAVVPDLNKANYKGSWIFFDFTPAVAEEGLLVDAAGVIIERFGFIMQQALPTNGVATPTVNPWVIRLHRNPFNEVQSIDPIVRDIYIQNAYNGIWVDGSGGAQLSNVGGLYFHTGLWSTNNAGHLVIDNWTTKNEYEVAVFRTQSRSSTVTISIASPAVIAWTGHGLAAGAPVNFSTTSALPTGITVGTNYFVLAAGLTANSFEVATKPGGTPIVTSGSQSGIQTATNNPYVSYEVNALANVTGAKFGRNDGMYIKGFNTLIANQGMWFNRTAVFLIGSIAPGSGADATTTASVTGCEVAPVLVPVVSGGQMQNISIVDGGAGCVSPVVVFGGAGSGFSAIALLEDGGSATAFRIERPYFDGVNQGFVFDGPGTRGNIWGMTYGWAGSLNGDPSSVVATAIQTTAHASFNYVEFSGSSILAVQRAVLANGTGVSAEANYIAINNSTVYNYDVNNEGYSALTASGTYDQIASSNTILSTGPSAYVPGASSAFVSTGNVPISGFSPNAKDTWQVIFAGPQGALTVTPTAIQTTVPEIDLFGSIDGHVAIGIAAHAGTPIIGFGTNSGTFAVSASSPLAVNATTGNLTCATCVTSSGGGAITGAAPVSVSLAGVVSITGTAGQVLAGASPAFTATPTLGVAGSAIGTLTLAGNSSGTVTITPQAAAGTGAVFSLPNVSGTPAISVPSPLALNTITGAVIWSGLTSGGVLYASSATAVGSSALLTASALMVGGGAGTAPSVLASLGTTTTVLHGNAIGVPSFGAVVSADLNITTTSCTNQFVTAISSGGVGTCTTDTLASAQHANQGTTTTVLHGNASGNPSFGAVSLSTDASGTLQSAQEPAHTGDVTNSAGSLALALANIPTATPMAGSLLATAIVAPSTPASGKDSLYVDSTDKRLHDKNDAGTIGTTVVAVTCTSQFVSAISTAGVATCATPAGGGDVSSNTATSVDSEIALFSSTTGKLIKRATGSGIATLTSGVLSATSTTGSGNVVLASTPTLVTPILGVATGTSVTWGGSPVGWAGGTSGLVETLSGANAPIGNGGNLRIVTTGSQASDLGGSLTFGGYYISNTSSIDFAEFAGRKENSSSSDTSGYAYIATRNTTTMVKNLLVSSLGAVLMPNLASSSSAQTGTVCWSTGTGNLTVDTTTTCLLSSAKYKHEIRDLTNSLDRVMRLRPVSYVYNEDQFIPGEQVGFIAEDVAEVDDRLVSREPDGSPRAVRYQQLTAELAGAIQQLKADNDNIRLELESIRHATRR